MYGKAMTSLQGTEKSYIRIGHSVETDWLRWLIDPISSVGSLNVGGIDSV
jgi:hypothetical protein